MRHITFFAVALLGLSAVPDRALGQSSDLEKTLASFGYKIQRLPADVSGWEKGEFNLQSKTRYAIKSVKPVKGERSLYYSFSVDVEGYANETDAVKRSTHIDANPPGPDSKMQPPEYALRVGFRRGNVVYVVGTHVYQFVVTKDLARLRDDLERSLADQHAAKKGILIGYIAARRSEAVEASRLLEVEGFRVTLTEYPETSTGGVTLHFYPTGAKGQADKIVKGIECIVSNVAIVASPNSSAMFGVDYLLTFGR